MRSVSPVLDILNCPLNPKKPGWPTSLSDKEASELILAVAITSAVASKDILAKSFESILNSDYHTLLNFSSAGLVGRVKIAFCKEGSFNIFGIFHLSRPINRALSGPRS